MLLLFTAGSVPALAQTVVDPNLKVQTWVRGLDNPTGVAFVDNGATALVLEKSTGQVRVVKNRAIAGTALDLPVANDSERGLLGIALSPHLAADHFVYLSYTASDRDGASPIDNRVERYAWNGSNLTFDRRVLTMPGGPGPNHNGGKITFGPDQKLYAVTGDLNRNELTTNFESSAAAATRSAAVLRVNPSGSNVSSNPFKTHNPRSPLNDIYAYGIRNSFGLAFDPRSGFLWDTENGPDRMDEINRVDRAFNSGWEDVMGPSSRDPGGVGKLVSLGPSAHYEEPKFSWSTPVAPTDAFFMDTTRLGKSYAGDFFVGTVLDGGVLFKFDMSPSRKTLGLSGALADGVADNATGQLLKEQSDIVFGNGFGVVTDIASGPGGMYVLSLTNGVMYRITTATSGALPMTIAGGVTAVPEPPPLLLIGLAGSLFLRRGDAKKRRTA
jgi:glucose/arabinose dehydrogenase